MPTTYRPKLQHTHFDWNGALAQLEAALHPRRDDILRAIGFHDEYGDPSEWTEDAKAEVLLVLEEIAAILAKGAAIAVDAGFKPVNQILATLRAIYRNPSLVIRDPESIEPEALGVLAKNYDRGDGVGKSPFDVTGDSAVTPTAESLRDAAKRGIEELMPTAHRGRRTRVDLDYLAAELGGVFRQFSGTQIKRIVLAKTRRDLPPVEDGRFKQFLELVLPPLERVLAGYPEVPHRISRDNLVKRAKRPLEFKQARSG